MKANGHFCINNIYKEQNEVANEIVWAEFAKKNFLNNGSIS